MSEQYTKPRTVIYEFTLTCHCGGTVTLSNRRVREGLQYGSKTFWFRCTHCHNEGKATWLKETIYPDPAEEQKQAMTPQEIGARCEAMIDRVLEENKENAEHDA